MTPAGRCWPEAECLREGAEAWEEEGWLTDALGDQIPEIYNPSAHECYLEGGKSKNAENFHDTGQHGSSRLGRFSTGRLYLPDERFATV